MEHYLLPQTELKVSKLAFGCMRIAGKTVSEVEELVVGALAEGINFFDHADIYGAGKSESIFGEVLSKNPGMREKMVIQSKCAIVPGQRYDSSKEYIIDAVTKSLERLQCGYLDILLLHRPDALCDPKEVAEAFDELYEKGMVKYFGVSNYTPMQIELLQKYVKQPLMTNQVQFSIVHSLMIDSPLNYNMTDDQAIDRDGNSLDYCRLHDITIQSWSSLQASWAEGTFIDNPNYPKLNEKLQEIATANKVTKSAVAIAWLLRHPANIVAVIGTTSMQHLSEMAQATSFTLTRQQWYDLYLAEGKPLP